MLPPPPDQPPATHAAPFALQKMDKNQDGVVTIEEFLETCQKVSERDKPLRSCSGDRIWLNQRSLGEGPPNLPYKLARS